MERRVSNAVYVRIPVFLRFVVFVCFFTVISLAAQ